MPRAARPRTRRTPRAASAPCRSASTTPATTRTSPAGPPRRCSARSSRIVGVTLEEIADRLYALPPEDFTAARADEAKAAGKPVGKQVAALRKPTVSAWIVNALARAEPEMLEQLLALGPLLAEAQRGKDKDQLVSLGEQRR